jgi:hypothetical protein
MSHERHPRARALRLTYILIGVWFLILAVALGLLTRDASAGVVAGTLLTTGFVVGVAASAKIGLVPQRGPRPGQTRAIALAGAAAAASAVTALVVVIVQGSIGPAVTGTLVVVSIAAVVSTARQIV